MSVFTCPRLWEPQWGVTDLGGCQGRGDSQLCQFPPPPAPCPGALWTPLPTPFILGLPRIWGPKSLLALTAQRPAVSCKELVLGIQGRKQSLPLCSQVTEIPPSAPASWGSGLSFQEVSRGYNSEESGVGGGTSLQPGTRTQSRDCYHKCLSDSYGVADKGLLGLDLQGR